MTNKTQCSHIYLDMIGGIAGDMFIAAMCDLDSDLENTCRETFTSISETPAGLTMRFHTDGLNGNFGKKFDVSLGNRSHEHEHSHVGYSQAKDIVDCSEISNGAKERALAIFEILAKSEGEAHGVPWESVLFHEIGGWDSIVDIILSASIIDKYRDVNWMCGTVPMGSGSVQCAHGVLPVPAPATISLLHGFEVRKDSLEGERVTPTGAAILKNLMPKQTAELPGAVLVSHGSGFGNKTFPGCANVLRAYSLRDLTVSNSSDIAIIDFDLDDQTAEDIAISLESLRDHSGVLDVVQSVCYGKKGRIVIQVRVLSVWEERISVANHCLAATSTLGVRYYSASRVVLHRGFTQVLASGENRSVKMVERPDGQKTSKIEADDLLSMADSFGERESLRREAGNLISEERDDKS